MSNISIDIMASLYLSGSSCKKIGESIGKSYAYVYYKLLDYEVSIRKRKKYICNEDYFEIIDTEEKGYWVGFLAADGSVSSKKNVISLGLHSKDRGIIEKFKKALEATNLIDDRIGRKRSGYKTISRISRLRIRSAKMKEDLINKGVVPRKSLILEPPKNIPKRFYRDWVRGYFDGDGSVWINRGKYPVVGITGTKEVLEFIREAIGCYSSIRRRGNVYTYRLKARKKVERFFHVLYDNSTLYMERKYSRFIEYGVIQ